MANANLSWILTKGPMTTAHGYYGAAKLQDGRVLAISGDSNGGLTPVTDVYNPASGTWSQTGAVNQPRYGFYDAVTLNSGKVLIAGGTDATASTDYASAELYDPSTGKWGYTGSLNTARRNPVVVKLQDGRVLVASGANGPPDGNRFLFTSEIYNPATGQFTYTTGNLPLAREGGDSGVLLHDGRVMMLGGEGPWLTFSPEVELYNPASDTWSETGNLPHGISGGSLVVLQDGRVMLIGGDYNGSALAEVELYDPATGTWSAAAPLHHARDAADSILLPNGKVLVAGGSDGNGNAVLASEIYDPSANSWIDDALLQHMHVRARMIQLDSGELLMAGGYDSNGPTTASELYTSTPGGTWITPSDGFSVQAGTTLQLSANASPAQSGSSIQHVDFAVNWDGTWHTVCTTTSSSNTFGCNWNLEANGIPVPNGAIQLQFTAYDSSGTSFLSLTLQGTITPPQVQQSSGLYNWAGYAVTGSKYTDVKGSWVQPAIITCGKKETSLAAFWVGLDGVSPGTLEQIGTAAACKNGKISYYAWYEMVPDNPVTIFTGLQSGDNIQAEVSYQGNDQFKLSITIV